MRRPPRLVARTLTVTFGTVAIILAAVFVVLMVEARDRVRDAEIEKLRVAEQVFTGLEVRRQQDEQAAVATLAENPTLKAALDTYFTESRFNGLQPEQEASLRDTVTLEAEKLAALTRADAIAIADSHGNVFVSAGPSGTKWPRQSHIPLAAASPTFYGVVVLPQGAFRITGTALRLVDRNIGALVLGTSLDANYARRLSDLASAEVVITVEDKVVASTLPEHVTPDFPRGAALQSAESRTLGGEEYAIRTLMESGPVRVYTLASISAAARRATRAALMTLGNIAFGALLLAAFGSFWLARTLTDPIDRLSREIGIMTAARDLRRPLHPTGSSRELDALAAAFNELVKGASDAEAETRAAYLGAIRALAAALDARDPYTAGHSERVSAVSVLMGRHMKVSNTDLEVLRLGALLHDIGKIGVSDEVLRKPGPLTREEFEQLKRHPGLGARILRQVPFLALYVPVVELHHERPDGDGYPFGLRGEQIPLAARIVHVADAFDAITSERAYRPSRGGMEALGELQKHVGTQFDSASVNALVAVLPQLADITPELALQELLGRQIA